MKKDAIILFVILMMSLTGCVTAQVDRTAAKATAKAPEVAQVESISIPDNPSRPTYIVAVEPFTYGAVDVKSGGHTTEEARVPGQHNPGPWGWWGWWAPWSYGDSAAASTKTVDVKQNPSAIGPGIAAQLLTAMSNDANIQMIDIRSLKKKSDGTYSCKLSPGERGPFIITGIVTEFSETADMSTESTGGSLGAAGSMLGWLGAVTGTDALTYAGYGTAAANPSLTNEKKKRTGMVGMDIQIIDGRNHRIIGAFHSSGSFTTVSAVNGMSVFGIGSSNTDYAASAIGQATRAAMNDSITKINHQLTAKIR